MTEGFRPKFLKEPILHLEPPSGISISENTAVQLDEFIPSWLESGVIREITTPTFLHFSIIFFRLKKNGKKRPIIDLSTLNDLLDVPTFKMETVAVIAKSITRNLWACSVDIKDAYLHVPINWDFHKYLAFKVRNRTFVFQFFPFGLSPAP